MDPSLRSTTFRPSAPSLPWVSDPRAQGLLNYLQIAYPIALILIFITAFTVRSIVTARNDNDDTPQSTQLGPGGKPLPKKSQKNKSEANAVDFSRPRKLLFISLQAGVLLSFVGNIALVIFHALLEREQRWWCGQAPTIYLIGSFMVYALLQITLIDTKPSPTLAHLIAWTSAALMEITLLGASFGVYTTEHREPKVGDPRGGRLQREMSEWEITEVTLDLVRVLLLIAMVAFYSLFVYLQGITQKRALLAQESERQSLLGSSRTEDGDAATHANGYGTSNGSPNGKPPGSRQQQAPAGWEKPQQPPARSWWEYIRAYGMFIPYIWPYKNRRLQVFFVISILIVLLQRGIQVLVL